MKKNKITSKKYFLLSSFNVIASYLYHTASLFNAYDTNLLHCLMWYGGCIKAFNVTDNKPNPISSKSLKLKIQ